MRCPPREIPVCVPLQPPKFFRRNDDVVGCLYPWYPCVSRVVLDLGLGRHRQPTPNLHHLDVSVGDAYCRRRQSKAIHEDFFVSAPLPILCLLSSLSLSLVRRCSRREDWQDCFSVLVLSCILPPPLSLSPSLCPAQEQEFLYCLSSADLPHRPTAPLRVFPPADVVQARLPL